MTISLQWLFYNNCSKTDNCSRIVTLGQYNDVDNRVYSGVYSGVHHRIRIGVYSEIHGSIDRQLQRKHMDSLPK